MWIESQSRSRSVNSDKLLTLSIQEYSKRYTIVCELDTYHKVSGKCSDTNELVLAMFTSKRLAEKSFQLLMSAIASNLSYYKIPKEEELEYEE